MNVPNDRKYLPAHQWAKEEKGRVLVGITEYAQRSLHAIAFLNLPECGDAVRAGEPFGEVESAKVVSELISPVSGTVCRVNEELLDDPSIADAAPYDAWFIEVENVTDTAKLLTAKEYLSGLEDLND